MKIGILGTGRLAAALGMTWTRAGHEVVIAGRSREKAEALARELGSSARASTPPDVAANSDAVLLAVAWSGVPDILHAASDALNGIPLIDPTNAVEHGVGVLLTPPAISAAQRIAALAPGAHVVKALNLFPGEQWVTAQNTSRPIVPLCGDDPAALDVVAGLVRDIGAVPAVLGPLQRARQLEEVAGFVIGLAFAGHDPNAAIPRVPAADETEPATSVAAG